ncbi:remorin 4.1 [Vigna unguiculata]|uniref:Remorin n=1 Tax=Vigna unguiculata TaxID=3917 RepID=A0A4D6M852_VIGUN|nr:remorin 4.1 [Vigna unguiculata]QCD97445.1 Remorin [Vigna unguiculata]
MFNDPSIMGSTSQGSEDHEEEDEQVREIHALTPTHPPHPRGRPWDTLHTHRSSSLSVASTDGGASSSDNFTTMSREFNALVLAGSSIDPDNNRNLTPVNQNNVNNNLGRIREDELMEETNPLAIVPDNHPLDPVPSSQMGGGAREEHVSVQRVKKEEVDTKISAWQNAKVAKINNRFKREDAVINGWESEQVQKASSWMKKVERKLEEKRARAMEKMQNDIAKAHRKAEERRASAEAKRGTKVARVLEIASLMRAVGRAPAKKSFF